MVVDDSHSVTIKAEGGPSAALTARPLIAVKTAMNGAQPDQGDGSIGSGLLEEFDFGH
jgi:hypothetical protein